MVLVGLDAAVRVGVVEAGPAEGQRLLRRVRVAVGGVHVHEAPRQRAPGLNGSIGEGPNQTNYSDRSSVRILGIGQNSFKIQDLSLENSKKF